jgi:glucokinase
MAGDVYVGVDVGGTNIKCARVKNGEILERVIVETRADEGFKYSYKQILSGLGSLTKGIRGIGVGIAGIIDSSEGVVRYSPNMPGWDDIQLASLLKKEFGVRVCILNDVNAVCLGEWQYGAAKGCSDVFMLTVGTGVGGAAVCNGIPQFGAHGFAGEIGHMIIKEDGRKCLCGNRGCLEGYVGVRPIVRLARKMMRKKKSTLRKYHAITPQIIAEEARKEDRIAQKVYERIGYYLGVGITNIIHLYDPQIVIVSGGIAKAGRILFNPLRKTVKQHVMGSKFRNCKIAAPVLGDNAGILGAVYFAKSVERKTASR